MFSESRSESAFLLYVKSLHSRKKKKKKGPGGRGQHNLTTQKTAAKTDIYLALLQHERSP